MLNLPRRHLLYALGAAPLCSSLRAAEDPWARVPGLLKRIQAPRIPARDFPITRNGAKDDGKTDCTEAFAKSISEANRAGGGRVVVPAGTFLTGAIHLKSNVALHVSEGATVRFLPDPKLYPIVVTRFEGMELMNYSPFVYAFEQQNVAVTGSGTLDGQAGCEHWWPWAGKGPCSERKGPGDQKKARAALMDMIERGTPVAGRVFGDGGFLRPMFIQPYRCANVLIEGVRIVNSPMYEIHPVLCRNVTVRGVTVSSHGPNNDGCDPESCSAVLIENCTFDTGDDCIAIKSGRNADGRRLHAPSENIIVQGCTMQDGHGGVTLGSECSGGIRWVFARDCRMDSPHLDRVLRFKNNAMRGGVIENVFLRNVRAGQVAGAAVEVDFRYEEGDKGGFTPVVRNVDIEHLECSRCRNAMVLRGLPNARVADIRLRRCNFDHAEQPNVIEYVNGLVLEDVTINGVRATD